MGEPTDLQPDGPTTSSTAARGSEPIDPPKPPSNREEQRRAAYIVQEPGRRAVTEAAAKDWFEPQKVLAFGPTDIADARPEWFANSESGGTKSRPDEGISRLEILAVPPNLSTNSQTEEALLDGGTLQLFQGQSEEEIIHGQGIGRRVLVRGQVGRIFTAGTLYGATQVCTLSWSEPGKKGQFTTYMMRARRDFCDADHLVEIANRLVVP